MQESKVIKYIDVKSKDYSRVFSNTTFTALGPYGDVTIDFCEEAALPLSISERPLKYGAGEVKFSHDPNEILVEREKKVSVTMSKDQALDLARWIMDNCQGDD